MRMRSSLRLGRLMAGLLLMLGLIGLVFGPAAAGSMTRLTLGTSSVGGTYFVWGGGWAKVMGEHVEGVDISVEVTGGPATNIQLIQQKKMDLGFATVSMAYQGWNGLDWANGKKHDRIRAIFPMYASVLHIYALESSPIKTVYDFEGKRITTGAPGSTSDVAGRDVLKLLGITPKKISSLPTNTAVDALRDGTADAGFAVTGLPGPFMLDLETTHKVRHIGLSQKDLDRITEAFPYYSAGMIPKGTYKHQEGDVPTVTFWNVAIADRDLPDDVVYSLVKATFENKEALTRVDPNAAQMFAENIKYSTVPLHPGALRYYREKGIKIPERLLPPQ